MLSSLYAFFLAMKLYPATQERAQRELDALLLPSGRSYERLPQLSDRPSLPYIDSLIKELIRWSPTTPLGVPHRLTCTDVYHGMRIPKGSTVLVNVWSIFRNATLYPNPMEFNPDRFLGAKSSADEPNGLDPRSVAFGFGRRVCPGRHLADCALWTTIVHVLSLFSIQAAADAMCDAPEYTTGLVSRPQPFTCSIRPRWSSSEVQKLIDLN